MKGRASRLALSMLLVTLAALQLGAASVDFHAILRQINQVMRKDVDQSAPSPSVYLDPVPVGKPGQRIDLSIQGKDFAKDAMVYFPNPFVDHIAQKVVSASRISATIALAADVWPGSIDVFVVNPSSGKRAGSEALRVPGRLELDLKAENGLRIRFTQRPPNPESANDEFSAELFEAGASTPFVKGVGSLNLDFESDGGVSGTIGSEDPDHIPPCGGFDIDVTSIGPGKRTFTGHVQCDNQVEMKITGTARRIQ